MVDPVLTPGMIIPAIMLIEKFLKSNIQHQTGEEEKVRKLQNQLEKTKSVAVEIENRKPNNDRVRQWAEKAKVAVSHAERVINNLENRKAGNISIKTKGKTFFRRLFHRDEDLNSLDDLVKEFEHLNSKIEIIMPLIMEQQGPHRTDKKSFLCGFGGLFTGLVCGISSACFSAVIN